MPKATSANEYLKIVEHNIFAEYWAFMEAKHPRSGFPGWRSKFLEEYVVDARNIGHAREDGSMQQRTMVAEARSPSDQQSTALIELESSLVIFRDKLCLLRMKEGNLVFQFGCDHPFLDGFATRDFKCPFPECARLHEESHEIMHSFGYIGDFIRSSIACAAQIDKPQRILNAIANPQLRRAAVFTSRPLSAAVPHNEEQLETMRGLRYEIEGIQGPPGTGKSTTIFHIIHSFLPADEVVLATCVQNKAIESIVEKLETTIETVPFLVIGNVARLGSSSQAFLLDPQVLRDSEVLSMQAEILRLTTIHRLQKATVNAHLNRFISTERPWRTERLAERLRQPELANLKGSPSTTKEMIEARQEVREDFEAHWLSRDPWRLLWKSWVKLKYGRLAKEMKETSKRFVAMESSLVAKKIEVRERLIAQARVVLCTTQTAPSLSPLALPEHMEEYAPLVAKIKTAILDEAGTVPESKLPMLASLNLDRLISIGDQQQLRPFTHINSNGGAELQGFFERLASNFVLPMLTMQYRMHFDICAFVSGAFYANKLITPRETQEQRQASGSPNGMYWLDYALSEGMEEPSKTSKINKHEASLVVQVIKNLVQRGLRFGAKGGKRLMIITFYKPQKRIIEEELSRDEICSAILPLDTVVTVDSSQGSEADVVLLSCVRANRERAIGFVSNPNRMCVGTSRSKELFIVIGNSSTMLSNDNFRSLHELCSKTKIAAWF